MGQFWISQYSILFSHSGKITYFKAFWFCRSNKNMNFKLVFYQKILIFRYILTITFRKTIFHSILLIVWTFKLDDKSAKSKYRKIFMQKRGYIWIKDTQFRLIFHVKNFSSGKCDLFYTNNMQNFCMQTCNNCQIIFTKNAIVKRSQMFSY